MADNNIPAEIQIEVAKVHAWEATAKPGELPPMDVHAAALNIQKYRAAQAADQPRLESAIDKFKRTVRQDAPPQMPAWDPALAGNSQSRPGERASDRFKRQRMAQFDRGK